MMLESVARLLWYRERLSWPLRIATFPLWLASLAVGLVARLRRWAHRAKIAKSTRVEARVVSVGNIVAGGAGKTPVVLLLAQKLAEKGEKVAVLSRGYGGRPGPGPCVVSTGEGPLVGPDIAGDEPVLLARNCPGVAVVVCARRDVAARKAVADLGAKVLLLDDGFQHLRLARDVDIVVVDAERAFGNGHLLPLGPLREPASALRAAHVVWLSRCDEPSAQAVALADAAARRGQAVVRSAYRVAEVVELESGGAMGRSALSAAKVFMLAGIARPDSFRAILETAGASVVGQAVFPDHHAYRREEIDRVQGQAREVQADAVVTTEKDAVRLLLPPAGWLAVRLGVEIVAGEPELWRALDR